MIILNDELNIDTVIICSPVMGEFMSLGKPFLGARFDLLNKNGRY
jgi:hypothetical protein